MLNSRKRVYESPKYLEWLHKLPCSVTGQCGDDVQVHHAAPKGMSSIQNDLYGVPLKWNIHHRGVSHITEASLANQLGEDPRDRIIALLGLYIDQLEGRYDVEADMECGYMGLRKRLGIT